MPRKITKKNNHKKGKKSTLFSRKSHRAHKSGNGIKSHKLQKGGNPEQEAEKEVIVLKTKYNGDIKKIYPYAIELITGTTNLNKLIAHKLFQYIAELQLENNQIVIAAQFNLGRQFFMGDGIKKNLESAKKYFEITSQCIIDDDPNVQAYVRSLSKSFLDKIKAMSTDDSTYIKLNIQNSDMAMNTAYEEEGFTSHNTDMYREEMLQPTNPKTVE
uniref:Uncharacterized protein n=1 Tax=viral metagenome TaxID=1070528 RepID=A0A6C0F0X8_9ZZZZ